MNAISVEESNDNLLSFENRGFAGADLIDKKDEMESSTTSTLISGERPENQLLDSLISIKSDDEDNQFDLNQTILPQKNYNKASIEAVLCEEAESHQQPQRSNKMSIEAVLCQQAESHQPIRGDSSEISDEELVEYPKSKEVLKISHTSDELQCTSPASQVSDSKQLTSSTSAQTIPTSNSEYLTCKSNESVMGSGTLTSVASYLTANDKTLSVSHSDSTLSSDSGTLIDERDDQQEQNYDELDITPTKEMPTSSFNKFTDLKDEEDDDSSSTADVVTRTIISNVIKEPYDTEISLLQLQSGLFNEPSSFTHQIESQEQSIKSDSTTTSKLPRLSLSEQSESDKGSIETAIYRGVGSVGGGESDFSSFESTNTAVEYKNIRDEQMPNIMATVNLDQWDDSNLDDEMVVHEDVESSNEKKNSVDLLYTLEEEEESREDSRETGSNKLQNQQLNNLKQQQQQCSSSADNSNSLMEFERLEKELDQGSTKLLHHSSLDSIGSIGSTGLVSTPKIMNISQSDNTSVNSLNEFERLEKEIDEQSKTKLLTEIDEGHESQAESQMSDSADTTISGRSVLKKEEEEEDNSEIELELNAAKIDLDDLSSCPTQQQIVDELVDVTPIHQTTASQPSSIESQPKEETYDEEEVLKIVTTTENRIIEELKEESGNEEIGSQSTLTTRTTMKTLDEIDDGETTQTTIKTSTTTTTTSTKCIDETELNKYLEEKD